MIIKEIDKNVNLNPFQYILFPDQFVSQTKKESKNWIQTNMDYYANCAYSQYVRNVDTWVKNYDLVNGILSSEDFYEDNEPVPFEAQTMIDSLVKDMDLPKYVQHYSIFNGPLNDLVGEMAKRPNTHRVKAFDDDSRSEEMQFRTELLEKYVFQKVREQLLATTAVSGGISDEDLTKLTLQEVEDQISNYTSDAESWCNHILDACKIAFNMKEQSEDGFRDLFIAGREYFLPYEDNSKLGFNVKLVNPKNAWFHTVPDQKWTKSAFFGGTIEVMELSQIIEDFPDLTTDEIDELRKGYETFGVLGVAPSNYGTSAAGINTINYNTYSPAVVQARLAAESELAATNNNTGLSNLFGLNSNFGAFGQKYVVVRAYWLSKKKVKNVKFLDEEGYEQTITTDEEYKTGDIPTEISVEEGWINQWWEGDKIGPHIYHAKPYKLLDRFPLIGLNYNIKNSEVRAPIEFLKPFQAIYNVCMNQLWELLGKEKGPILNVQLRRIPIPKDGDEQDAIEAWMTDAEKAGVVFEDDSPENARVIPNTQQTRILDWSLTQQIQSRLETAIAIKNEAYELIGFSRQRLASVQATETATATNTAIAQSYAQTEPLFAVHDYLMTQVYQAIIDCAQYTQSQKPLSSLRYITSLGEAASIEIAGSDLKMRDFWLFDTSRPEDVQMFNELKLLAQPYMQNGGDMSEVVELYTNQSVRALKKVFKDFKAQRDAQVQQAQQLEQAKLEQQAQASQAALEQQDIQNQREIANDNINKEKDRQVKVEVAIIQSLGMSDSTSADFNQDSVPDIYQGQELLQKANEIAKKHDVELQKLSLERDKLNSDNINKEKDRQIDRDNMKNDLAIAKQNAKGRNKSSSTKKKK